MIGKNVKGNALLCKAFGESDRPSVEVVTTLQQLITWLVDEVGGPNEELQSIIDGLKEHDWDDDGVFAVEYEIGGLDFLDVVFGNIKSGG